MPSIELNASERPFITLMEADALMLLGRYQELMTKASQVKAELESLRTSTFAAIVQRARDEGLLEGVKTLRGLPEIKRDETDEPTTLVWPDGGESTQGAPGT